MANPRQSVDEYGKQFRERAPAAPAREASDEQEAVQSVASPIRQQLQAQFGRTEVDMAISGDDQSPFSTFILAEWAMGTAGLGSLTEASPEAGAHVQGVLQSPEWGEASAGIISRYATSNEPAHAHLAVELIRRSRGQRLPSDVASRLSAALGVDISDAVIHTDSAAAEAAKAVNAHAFATGKDVFFAAGKYNPGTKDGDELLAHELTHVVQDAEGRIPTTTGEGLTVSTPNQSHEREAERAGQEAASMLHDSGAEGALVVDASMEMNAPAVEESAQSADLGSDLHRAEGDQRQDSVPTEWRLMRGTVPESVWRELREIENAFHLRVLPAYDSWSSYVADAAEVAEDYFLPLEEFVQQRMDGLRDVEAAEAVAEEREYESSEESEYDGADFEDSTSDQSPSAEGAMEEQNEDLEALSLDALLAIDRLDLFQEFFALAVFNQLRSSGAVLNDLLANGVLDAHQRRINRASEKAEEAHRLLENFVQDVFLEVVESKLRALAVDLTITGLLAIVAPPAAAVTVAARGSRWALEQLTRSAVDIVTSDGEAPKFDQDFVNGHTNAWAGRAVDIKKIVSDTDDLSGPWERIEVLNNTLGRVISILEVEQIAKDKLAAIHSKLAEARSAQAAVDADWPDVKRNYERFDRMATQLKAVGPQCYERADLIRSQILEIETELGWHS